MHRIRPALVPSFALLFCLALAVLWPATSRGESLATGESADAATAAILDQATAGLSVLSGTLTPSERAPLSSAQGEVDALFAPQVALPESQRQAKAPVVRASIRVRVSVAKQRMEVWLNGELWEVWPVSTARRGKVTPRGTYRPEWLSKNHKSSLYNDAPMPYAIFFNGDYAIHGTDQERKLGRPASAGCVRLSRANAKKLFALVQKEGKERMVVEILD